ncbi:hypothetical protein [Nocardia cyriacigeorgica]|uniref:hypothetical protein n=1 Tax=Nocardia cyriacigeorgica TaxID=135487 RepID=UPI002456F8F3|nr:hypothetical protein [Nocardia cyriacigeorgica]
MGARPAAGGRARPPAGPGPAVPEHGGEAARREAVRTGVGPIPEPADIAAQAASDAAEMAAAEEAMRAQG